MFNKKILIAAMGATAFMATHANANVDLTAASPTAAMFATEIAVGTGGQSLTNAGNELDVVVNFGFAAAQGVERFLRFDLSDNALFDGIPALTGCGASVTLSTGGNASSFVIFSVSDAGIAGILSTANCTLAPLALKVSDQSDVDISYAHYEDGVTAVAEGTSLSSDSGSIISYASALDIDITAVTPLKIDVASSSKKLDDGVGGTTQITVIGNIEIALSGSLWTTGVAATFADFTDDTTNDTEAFVVSGNFASTQNADGTYTVAALTRVFTDTTSSACAASATDASALTATSATFTDETVVAANTYICLETNSTTVIEKGDYTLSYNPGTVPTGADTPIYSAGLLSTLEKNGASADVELLLTPGGTYSNWIRISNTSGVTGDVFVTLWNDAGDSVSFPLGDVAGEDTSLVAGGSTGLINIVALHDAAVAADATFDIDGGKLRADVEGEFSSIDVQDISTSIDGNSFSTFQ